MKTLPLSQGKVALLDDADAERPEIAGVKWYAARHGRRWYAERGDRGRTVYLHRVVLGLNPGDSEVDHANRNGLDCRRANLRTATRSQNNANQESRRGTSRFQGVCWDRRRGKWLAQIRVNRHQFNLGRYDSEEAAARAYDVAAIEAFGAFARTNW